MTGIQTYNDLIGEIQSFMADESIGDRAPTFIQFAEARFNRVLNTLPQEVRGKHVTEAGEPYATIPPDFSGVRRMSIDSSSGGGPLDYMTPTALSDKYANQPQGQPRNYTVEGVEIKFGPIPDAEYTVEQVFTRDLRALSNEDGEESNWMLRQHPDVYLAQSLVMAEMYLVDDARMATWKSIADEWVAEIKRWDRDNRTPSNTSSKTDVPKPFHGQG